MIKQLNPEHSFYIPYLQPIKVNAEQAQKEGKIDKIELEDFVLPKEAAIYSDINGVENIYVDGQIVNVMTEIPSGIIYLINNDTFLKVERYYPNKNNVIQFPNTVNKAV
jgi:hypothetical protein